MKQELEDEYLVTFKKMVAQYNVFQQRLASRPTLKTDRNFHVFLTSEKIFDLRCKNAKEKLTGFFNSVQKSSDELLLSNTQNDVDDFFESEKAYLLEYGDRLTSWMEPLLELESEGEAAAERQRLNSLAVPGSAPSRAATKLDPGVPSRAAISSHLAGTMPPGLRGPERRAWLEERADSSVRHSDHRYGMESSVGVYRKNAPRAERRAARSVIVPGAVVLAGASLQPGQAGLAKLREQMGQRGWLPHLGWLPARGLDRRVYAAFPDPEPAKVLIEHGWETATTIVAATQEDWLAFIRLE